MAYLSYLGAHWTLILSVGLTVVALAAAGFFLKNWRMAVAAVAILGAGFAYQWINMEGYKRRVAEEAQVQVHALQERLEGLQRVAVADTLRAVADHNKISELEKLASETPTNDRACLDADAARRVRAIQ
jgi:hypothetical protein